MGSRRAPYRFALAWLALAASVLAAGDAASQEPAAAPAADTVIEAHVLLDRKLGAGREAQALLVEREARHGNAYAQYLLGSLYRLGMRHPAALFERDDDKAATYLSNAAVHGQLYAMASMAELELRRQRGMDAMVWAQAFTLYEKELRIEPAEDHQAYAAYLLQRCFEKIGRDDDTLQELEQAFAAFRQKHDAAIRAGAAGWSFASHNETGGATLEVVNREARHLIAPSAKEEKMKTPGLAFFLVGIDAEGKTQRRLVVDSLPDEVFAEGLTRVADHIRFNPVPGMTELRWGMIPVSFDNQTYALKQKKK
jgi:tetratricopeptide (TPR) repeat protein